MKSLPLHLWRPTSEIIVVEEAESDRLVAHTGLEVDITTLEKKIETEIEIAATITEVAIVEMMSVEVMNAEVMNAEVVITEAVATITLVQEDIVAEIDVKEYECEGDDEEMKKRKPKMKEMVYNDFSNCVSLWG